LTSAEATASDNFCRVDYEVLPRRPCMRRMTSPATPELSRFELDLCLLQAPTFND
jgi:hypothetical protein